MKYLRVSRNHPTWYIDIIKNKALPILKINMKDKFVFQQDNSLIHKPKESLEFFYQSGIAFLDQPPYSPDLNTIENIWATLFCDVYGAGSIKNLRELRNRINDCIANFNETKTSEVLQLYNSMPSRLCSILESHGQRINYYNLCLSYMSKCTDNYATAKIFKCAYFVYSI